MTPALWRSAPLLVAFWGWAALAVSASRFPFVLATAVAGFIASTCARRWPVASLSVEIMALVGVCVAVFAWAPAHAGFLIIGAVLVVIARSLVEVARRREG